MRSNRVTSFIVLALFATLWSGAMWNVFPLVEILTVLLGLFQVRQVGQTFRNPSIWLPLTAFSVSACVVYALNLPYFPNPMRELYVVVHCSIVPLVLFVAASQLRMRKADFERLITAASVIGTAFAVLVIAWVPGLGFAPVTRIVDVGRNARFEVPGSDMLVGATTIALYIELFLPAVIWGLFRTRSLTSRFVHLGCLLAMLVVLYATGTRFAWLAGMACFLTIAFLESAKRGSRARLFSALIIAVSGSAIIVALVASGYANDNLRERFLSIGRLLEGDFDSSSAIRLIVWQSAWDSVLSNPQGIGYLEFLNTTVLPDPITGEPVGWNTHSEWMLIALASGWHGALFVLITLVLVARYLFTVGWWRPRIPYGSASLGLGLLVVYSACSVFDTASNHPSSVSASPLFFLWLGFCVAMCHHEETDESVDRGLPLPDNIGAIGLFHLGR